MYKVLFNSCRAPVEIAKWLNDELALGNKFIACNGDFYIFEAAEHKRVPDVATCLCGGEYYTDKVLGVVCCRCQAPRR